MGVLIEGLNKVRCDINSSNSKWDLRSFVFGGMTLKQT